MFSLGRDTWLTEGEGNLSMLLEGAVEDVTEGMKADSRVPEEIAFVKVAGMQADW